MTDSSNCLLQFQISARKIVSYYIIYPCVPNSHLYEQKKPTSSKSARNKIPDTFVVLFCYLKEDWHYQILIRHSPHHLQKCHYQSSPSFYTPNKVSCKVQSQWFESSRNTINKMKLSSISAHKGPNNSI